MIARTARTARTVAVVVTIGCIGLLAVAFGPTLFGYEASIVSSGSMGRAAPAGSIVLTRMVDARAVGPGDIITFRRARAAASVTHRVIEVTMVNGYRAFRTMGDANATPDAQPVFVDGGIARVERVVPYAGHLVRWARTPSGWAVLFVLPIAGLTRARRAQRPRSRAREDRAWQQLYGVS